MDWDDARLALTVARAKTLSEAGRRLRVDQATVGRRLKRLEEALGSRLFDRTLRGYVPTAAGSVLVRRAAQMESEALGIEREVAGKEVEIAGAVRVTAPPALGAAVIAPMLAELLREHPRIEVDLLTDVRTLNLSRREADLALRLDRPREPSVIAVRVARVGTGLYASPEYLRRQGGTITDGFEGHLLVGYNGAFEPAVELRWIRTRAAAARIALRTNSVHAQLEAVRAGVGLGLLPAYLAENRTGLVRVLPPSQVVVRELWSAIHRDLRRVARLQVVRRFLADGLHAAQSVLCPRG